MKRGYVFCQRDSERPEAVLFFPPLSGEIVSPTLQDIHDVLRSHRLTARLKYLSGHCCERTTIKLIRTHGQMGTCFCLFHGVWKQRRLAYVVKQRVDGLLRIANGLFLGL